MPYDVLSGLKVLDLSQRLAGSFCAKILGLYGCEVVKVEPLGGDPIRLSKNSFTDEPHEKTDNPLFLHLNAGKKSITLDLNSTKGKGVFLKLVKGFDVIVETFQPNYMDKIGLEHNELTRVNPSLIQTSVTPFGQTGPYKNFEYTELTVFATTGAMHREGLPGKYPLKYGGEIAQYFAGSSAASATISSLYSRLFNGDGNWIDISIQECMAGHPHQMARRAAYIYSGQLDPRSSPRTSASGPREPYAIGSFRCKDGFVSFLPLGSRMWPNIAKMIDREDLIENPKFNTQPKRTEHYEELEAIFQSWLENRTRAEIFDSVQKSGVPGAPILRSEEVLENEQFRHREFFQTVDVPTGEKHKYTGDPFRLSNSERSDLKPAPLLGQHTEEVLTRYADISNEKVESLRSENII